MRGFKFLLCEATLRRTARCEELRVHVDFGQESLHIGKGLWLLWIETGMMKGYDLCELFFLGRAQMCPDLRQQRVGHWVSKSRGEPRANDINCVSDPCCWG